MGWRGQADREKEAGERAGGVKLAACPGGIPMSERKTLSEWLSEKVYVDVSGDGYGVEVPRWQTIGFSVCLCIATIVGGILLGLLVTGFAS